MTIQRKKLQTQKRTHYSILDAHVLLGLNIFVSFILLNEKNTRATTGSVRDLMKTNNKRRASASRPSENARWMVKALTIHRCDSFCIRRFSFRWLTLLFPPRRMSSNSTSFPFAFWRAKMKWLESGSIISINRSKRSWDNEQGTCRRIKLAAARLTEPFILSDLATFLFGTCLLLSPKRIRNLKGMMQWVKQFTLFRGTGSPKTAAGSD